jgi:hypothetical protein
MEAASGGMEMPDGLNRVPSDVESRVRCTISRDEDLPPVLKRLPATRQAAFLLLALLAASACAAAPAAASEGSSRAPAAAGAPGTPPIAIGGDVEVMPITDVRRGQKGYGVSVFAGTELQRFEVEILGVIQNQSPGVTYALARLSGQKLEETGIIAGMSGSPVYIDGKLVGAVSFGWPFAKEPIAGITPISAMRDMAGGVSLGLVPTPAATAPRDVSTLLPGKATREALVVELQKLRPAVGGQGAGAVAWSFSGFGAPTQALLAQSLGSVALSGQATGEIPATLGGGEAVAAILVDGDFRLAATGTVTERRGDDVLAFGHPFLGIGPVDIPMAPAEVVTVLSNQYNSFKIANFGPVVGAFRQDRLAGIRGQVGAVPTMLPVRVRIEGAAPLLAGLGGSAVPAPTALYDVRLARVPHLTPALLAVTVLGAQEAAAQAAGPLGLDLEARFDLGEHGTVALAQSFDGSSSPAEAAIHLLSYADFFINNGFAEVDLRGVEVTVRQHPAPRTAVLVGGYAERTELEPGAEVRLHLDLVPWRGEPIRHDVSLRLPEDLPAGRYSLVVGDGVTLDGVRMQVEPASPQRLDQALRLVRRFHSRRDLVALGLHAGDGLAVAGEVLPRLPGSLRSVWSAAASQSATALRMTVAQEHVEALPFPIEGAVRIDLQVVRREPVTAGAGAGEGADGAGAATPTAAAAKPAAQTGAAASSPPGEGKPERR